MFKNLKKAFKTLSPAIICAGFIFTILIPQISQAAIGISTPSVSSGELIRASDWNKVKLDLETIAAAVGSLQNQTWNSSGADTYYNSGNVGVGINAPTATMHLFATTPAANAVLFQIGTTDDPDRVRIDEDGDMSIDGKLVVRGGDIYESGGDLELSGEDSLYLSMDWNNNDADIQSILFGKNDDGAGVDFVELMRITEGGNVGIGTNAPVSKLQVDGAIQVGSDAGVCDTAKTGAMRYNSGAIERCDGTAWDALATTNVSDNLGSHTATQNLDLDVFTLVGNGGSAGIQITATGKVGVGGAAAGNFDVISASTPVLKVRTTATSGQDAYLEITGARTTSATSDIASIRLRNKDGAPFEGARIALRNGDGTDSTALGDLVFLTNKGSADNLTEKMRILDSGNIGIGTATPDVLFQVFKNLPNANDVVFKVGTNADANRFSVDEDGDVFNDGNYYVGGGNILASTGSVTVAGEDNLYLVTDWNNNDAENRSIIFGKNGVGGGGSFSELARINENGRVGIGVITPANKLHVVENTSTDRIATFENKATTGSPEGILVLTGQGAGPAPAFAVGTGTEATHTNKFVVTNSGKIGVGNNNPSALLDISGAGNGGYGLRVTETSTSKSNSVYTLEVDSSAHTSNLSAAGAMKVSVNSGDAFVIDGQGNVGIGTTTPGDTLHVSSASNAPVIIESTDSVSGINLKDSNGNNYLYGWLGKFGISDSTPDATLEIAYSGSGDYLNLSSTAANDGDVLTVDGTGNVGIGTASPSTKLHVVGETRLTGVSADGTGKVVCIKADSNLGTCTDAPNGSGVCTCS